MLLRTALRTTMKQVRHVTPVRHRHAAGLTALVYQQVERDFGMLAPPVSLHSPAPANLAAAWTMLRETLVVRTEASRAAKEAVAAAVSASNSCPYCVEVHTATLAALDQDPATETLAAWARSGGAWPFPAEQAPTLIGVAVAFHYLNRMVHVFLGDSPLPPGLPAGARRRAGTVLGRFMRGAAVPGGDPGDSVGLLPAAAPAADLRWAKAAPTVHDAFGRAVATVEAAAAASVPMAVRELLTAELSTWDGQPPGLSRSWLTGPVSAVPAAQQPAARLALLVAKASYQVDEDTVRAYRELEPSDTAMVELVSLAALRAARVAGTRLATGRLWAAAA
ncbi:carboxymuconolactone decarboxylase family protein [Actinophytocola sediminis]